MKAIETRYIPASTYRPARIVAETMDQRTYSRYPTDEFGGDTTEEAHRDAAEALCKKMGWPTTIVGGALLRSWVWVFLPGSNFNKVGAK